MKIVMIGAGKLATQLGKALVLARHEVLQVYSRTWESAVTLASCLQAVPIIRLDDLVINADLYILSVKDSVLAELIPQVCNGRKDKCFVHTAGSLPMDLFQGEALHYGVFYPMQTFSKERDVDFSHIPCFVEGSDTRVLTIMEEMAESMGSTVYRLDSEQRKYLHLAAVFACNFTNHCYTIAEELLRIHAIPFEVMLPLIDETARKVHEFSPSQAQTGPAVRYDKNVICAQSDLLSEHPYLQEIYHLMSQNIHRKYSTT